MGIDFLTNVSFNWYPSAQQLILKHYLHHDFYDDYKLFDLTSFFLGDDNVNRPDCRTTKHESEL